MHFGLRIFLAFCALVMVKAIVIDAKANDLTPKRVMDYLQIRLEKGFSAKDLLGFQSIVRRLDLDGNGNLSLDEYNKNTHFRGNPRGTRGFFSAADMNGDGEMSVNEYAWQRIITDEARTIFFGMDRGGDRRVSRKEFLQNKIIRSQDISQKIFQMFDTNSDGELSLPEVLRKWSRWARSEREFSSLY